MLAITISRYQKLFGIGPLSLVINLLLLAGLWLVDRAAGRIRILDSPEPLTVIGLILIGIWICWHAWCIKTIRLWWNKDQLCTTGPFRLVRHPIYAGGLVFAFLGFALILNSWIVLVAPVTQYFVLRRLVRREEAMMEEVFGSKYRDYASQTGCLFPRLRR